MTRLQIQGIEADLGYGFLDLDEERTVGRHMTVTGRDERSGLTVETTIEVDKAGNPHCRSLRIASPQDSDTWGDDVTTGAIRGIALGEIVHQCFAAAIQGQTKTGDDLYELRPLSDEERAIAFPKGALRSKQRKPLTDEELEAIAGAYRAAVARGIDPTKRIAERMDVNRSTARRWVARAVQNGFLDEADRLSPGARPVAPRVEGP